LLGGDGSTRGQGHHTDRFGRGEGRGRYGRVEADGDDDDYSNDAAFHYDAKTAKTPTDDEINVLWAAVSGMKDRLP
jgi:hypothetical protein